MNKRNLLLAALAITAVSANAYFEDFQGAVGAEWSNTSTDSTPIGSRNFLGQFGNETVSLTLSTVAGQQYELCFELFLINSWDGNQTSGVGPDFWKLDVDGSTTLLDTTFSNIDASEISGGYAQSYPDPFSAGNDYAAMTNADEIDTLGYTYFGNSVYAFGGSMNSAFNFTATGTTTVINFSASGLQGLTDESWGIDNVKVDAVPEPATMSLLGLGALAALRKKRKA